MTTWRTKIYFFSTLLGEGRTRDRSIFGMFPRLTPDSEIGLSETGSERF